MNKELVDSIYQSEIYSFQNKLAVIITKPWVVIDVKEKELLSKILGAIQSSLEKVNVIYSPLESPLRTDYSANFLLYFGPAIEGIPYYAASQWHGKTLITAEDLSLLANNDLGKKQLWNELKKLFLASV